LREVRIEVRIETRNEVRTEVRICGDVEVGAEVRFER
jgi:carbonic anhydrase/acetyltransferase-like protein (isoleucine patch superfamily)